MANIVRRAFEGHQVVVFEFRGRKAVIARHVGEVLGYADDAKQFVRNITTDWGDDLIEGTDWDYVRGPELRDLKDVLELGGNLPPSRAQTVVVLYEQGIHSALLKTDKPAGRRLRRFLADEVMPELARTGSYAPPSSGVHLLPAAAQTTAILHESAARILAIAVSAGIVGKEYAERSVSHSLSVLHGTAPPEGPRLLDVSTYLQGKGVTGSELRKVAPIFGKTLKKAFTEKHGAPPPMQHRLVNGSERPVCSYTEADLDVFDAALATVMAKRAS